MRVQVSVGRCGKCGEIETVSYEPMRTREADGSLTDGWAAVVACPVCGAARIVKAERITDFVLVLDTVEKTEKEENTNAGADVQANLAQ